MTEAASRPRPRKCRQAAQRRSPPGARHAAGRHGRTSASRGTCARARLTPRAAPTLAGCSTDGAPLLIRAVACQIAVRHFLLLVPICAHCRYSRSSGSSHMRIAFGDALRRRFLRASPPPRCFSIFFDADAQMIFADGNAASRELNDNRASAATTSHCRMNFRTTAMPSTACRALAAFRLRIDDAARAFAAWRHGRARTMPRTEARILLAKNRRGLPVLR